jgi:class 3 adenylate cyclase
MQQIADWLEKLGLGQYAQRFAENDIDFVILSDLTDQDLEVGHRRKLSRAIANLKGLETITPAVAIAAAPPATPRAADTAERRHVTVMFSDLVGSTALSARMDPEDLREVISAYRKCVAEAVRRFGGFVARYLGDGVLVYFGYPEAHEDDAERAVRAGLDLIAAVIALKTPASLQARVGIATGLVIVGDLTGSGEAQERGIVGETPNLAARLQGIAEPNTVVIAESTRSLLGNLFELKDLGAKDLKGVAEPVRAYGGAAGEHSGKPLRGTASERSDCPRRARRRDRAAVAALVAGEERRGSSGADFRRSGYRQIAAHSGSSRKHCSRTAYTFALFLLASAHR